MAETLVTPEQTVWEFENEALWTRSQYGGIESERARLTIAHLPADVGSVLDVGCGNGVLTNLLSEGKVAVGTDRSFTALGFVRKPRAQSDIVRLPFGDGAFDAVIAAEVIEHIPDSVYRAALAELLRVARRYVLITVPFREPLWMRRVRCPRCHMRFHEHGHVRRYESRDLEHLYAWEPQVRPMQMKGILPYERYALLQESLALYKQYLQPDRNYSRFAVCPACGYSRPSFPQDHSHAAPASRAQSAAAAGISPRIKHVARRAWPRARTHRWWLALYEKLPA